MSITIKDVAKTAGVSISTVSRVVNNRGYISDDIRAKVNSAIAFHNYVPNNNARNLKMSDSKNIALLVKGITNPFFNKMIRVIEEKIALRGYSLMIQNIDDSVNELDVATREAADRNLCGVLIMGGSFGYSDEKFIQLAIPCVLITVSADENISKSLYSSVKIDDEKEGYKATEYLISLGHRKIGFLYDDYRRNFTTPNYLRFLGYKKALKDYNIPYDEKLAAANYEKSTASGYITGFNAFKKMYAVNPDMTAIFAFADIIAIGAAKAALSLGLAVPNDMSIIGFDGIEIAEFYNPSIDTMYQPANEMALSSIEILFDMIQGGKSQHKVFDTVLLKRGSCCVKK